MCKKKTLPIILAEKFIHEQAVRNQENWYIEPNTGKKILTAYFLCNRGYCCRSNCRWCPFGFDENGEENWNEWNHNKVHKEK